MILLGISCCQNSVRLLTILGFSLVLMLLTLEVVYFNLEMAFCVSLLGITSVLSYHVLLQALSRLYYMICTVVRWGAMWGVENCFLL